jgi:hypothetical protein
MRVWIKIGAATLAVVPMLLLLPVLALGKVFPESIAKPIYMACAIFNFPAFSIFTLIQTHHLSKTAEFLCLFFCLMAWSSFMAWVFWKIAGTFLGEDEPEYETNPERAKYDWTGFWIRFVLGFIVGFLFGWRFVRNSKSVATLLTAMIGTGLFVGLAYGLYRPNFWSRP